MPGVDARGGPGENQRTTVRANCGVTSVNLAPFGAVLYPNERTGERPLMMHEDGEGGEWVCVSQKGWPKPLRDRPERVLSTWTWASASTPMRLAATWFYNGQPRQGLRFQSLSGDFALTERAIRIGMSAASQSKGPWALDDRTGKMVGLKNHCVCAAVIPYEDVEVIDGGRHYVEVHAGIAGVSLLGSIALDVEGGQTKPGTMDQFGIALVEALVTWGRSSPDPSRRAAAGQVAGADYRAELRKRRGIKYRFA